MKSRTKSIMAGLALAAIAIPGTVAADSIDAFAVAEVETEQQNLAWYTDLDTDAIGNESCREDLVEPAFVPEYDTNLAFVKGQITAVGSITCLDIEFESTAPIDGSLWLEARHGWNDWQPVHAVPIRDNMTAGFGTDQAVLLYTIQYDDPIRGLPLRVCIQTENPDPSEVLCRTVKAAASAAIDRPIE